MISLQKALRHECDDLHWIQVCSFLHLLDKYGDFHTNPAAETLDRIVERFQQEFTDYYFILNNSQTVGMMRICNFGDSCRISPICIMPEHWGRGFAQQAMLQVESMYPGAKKWKLETIMQEEKLCYLYEKLGYRRTGECKRIQDGMDIISYEKQT